MELAFAVHEIVYNVVVGVYSAWSRRRYRDVGADVIGAQRASNAGRTGGFRPARSSHCEVHRTGILSGHFRPRTGRQHPADTTADVNTTILVYCPIHYDVVVAAF